MWIQPIDFDVGINQREARRGNRKLRSATHLMRIKFEHEAFGIAIGNLFGSNARNPRDRMLYYRSYLVIRHDFSQDRRATENDKIHTLTEARSQSSTAMVIQTRGQHILRPSW